MDPKTLKKKLENILDEDLHQEEAEEEVVEQEQYDDEEYDEEYDEEIENEADDFIDVSGELKSDHPLFPDGPTVGEIEEWKEAFGEIYLTTINEEVFIWRPLTRKEMKEVHTKTSGIHQREEVYCQLCNIWPSDYDFGDQGNKAGIPSVLSEQILLKSGFQATHNPIAL